MEPPRTRWSGRSDVPGGPLPDMARNVSMGLCEMRVAVAARGSLRTGRKLRSIVDLRKTLFRAEAAIPLASTV